VQAAPAALGKSITAVVAAKGATAGGSTLVLVKGALKLMAWTKAKGAIVAGIAVVLTAGTATVAVKHFAGPEYQWQVTDSDLMEEVLTKAPPMVRLVAATSMYSGLGTTATGGSESGPDTRFIGLGETAAEVVETAYELDTPYRVVENTRLPDGLYNYIASLPSGSLVALQQVLQKQFGVVCRKETRPVPVLALRFVRAGAPGLRVHPQPALDGTIAYPTPDGMSWKNAEISDLTSYFETLLKIPVVDQTGFTNQVDIDLKWDTSPGGPGFPPREVWKGIVSEQLGLELVATTESIEVVVVDKRK
jgi:uncharacterized protein (TIGR03435 family)